MAKRVKGRVTATLDGDFVVFIIGMRVNKFWKIHKWLPTMMAMGPMIKELSNNPKSGFLGSMGILTMIQYWRSMDQLTDYARKQDANHYPAWVAFNKRATNNDAVGIWHETYRVHAGEYETIYRDMPRHGLGTIGTLIPASGKYATAKRRAGVDVNDQPPVEVPKETSQEILA